MAEEALLFQSPAPASTNLVFGDDPGESGGAVAVFVAAQLPAPTFVAQVARRVELSAVVALPALACAAQLGYASGAERPVTARTRPQYQAATTHRAQAQPAWRASLPAAALAALRYQAAHPKHNTAPVAWGESVRLRTAAPLRYQAAQACGETRVLRYQETRSLRTQAAPRYQEAQSVAWGAALRYQEMLRRERHLRGAYEEAQALSVSRTSHERSAVAVQKAWVALYQEAMRARPGRYVPPIPPDGKLPCYTPSGDLVFVDLWRTNADLIFVCKRPQPPAPGVVVVPVREVYFVNNSFSLTRADGAPVPATALSLSLDADSWTWGFSASLPGEALPLVQPVAGEPVELRVTVNGVTIHALAEQISRERSFGKSGVRVSGRGLGALLDAPYAPAQSFANPSSKQAQQLLADVLTVNGVSMGWALDWQLPDWLVPAGVFSHQGSYISAAKAIAGAAGGYLQPHRSAQTLRALPRYPVAPWEWGDATPDFILPADVAVTESMAWRDKPLYNRVYVSGQVQGIRGRVTRAGTAGDLAAPMVVDPLITHADAARQRGISILGDTGRQIEIGLRLPVLPETGIIQPGALVEYQEGGRAHRGLVRSTAVAAGFPDIYQTLGLEVHA